MRDLSDITFMIPVKFDSRDRINNLNIVASYLRTYFKTNIIIAEQDIAGHTSKVLCKTLYDIHILYRTNSPHFYKAKLVNAMAKAAKTPYIAMYDSDILLELDQYQLGINALRSGQFDFVYPFNGHCINISKDNIQEVMEKFRLHYGGARVSNARSLATGGVVYYSKQAFFSGGMMNENFTSYGPEDAEQDIRFKRLGFRNKRVGKPLYHLDHIRTINSTSTHAHNKSNWAEMNKIKRMNSAELKKYIGTWSWCNV